MIRRDEKKGSMKKRGKKASSYVKHAQCHRQTGEPSRSRLQEPGQFLHAAVMEGVSGDSVPALGGQWLMHPRIISGSVGSAASDLTYTSVKSTNLNNKYFCSPSMFPYSFLDYSQNEARRLLMGVADKIVYGPFDDRLNLTVVCRIIKDDCRSG